MMSQIGNVFGSLGSGVASIGGPVGMGVGAGFSVIGGLLGLGGQIQERKQQEQEQERALLEQQRQAQIQVAQDTAASSGEDVQRAQAKQQTQQKQSGQMRTNRPAPLQSPTTAMPGQPGLQEQEIMGPELRSMFAGLQPGQGGFYGQR